MWLAGALREWQWWGRGDGGIVLATVNIYVLVKEIEREKKLTKGLRIICVVTVVIHSQSVKKLVKYSKKKVEKMNIP